MKKIIISLSIGISLVLSAFVANVFAQSCTCPNGGIYDPKTQTCGSTAPTCQSDAAGHPVCNVCGFGFIYNTASNSCVAPTPACTNGNNISSCSCPDGFSVNGSTCSFDSFPYCPGQSGSVTITSPFGTTFDTVFHNVVNRITSIFLFVIGLILFAFIIYAGFLWMTDAGNEENAKKAKKVLTSAVVGIAIIGLTGFIIKLIEAIFGISLGV